METETVAKTQKESKVMWPGYINNDSIGLHFRGLRLENGGGGGGVD